MGLSPDESNDPAASNAIRRPRISRFQLYLAGGFAAFALAAVLTTTALILWQAQSESHPASPIPPARSQTGPETASATGAGSPAGIGAANLPPSPTASPQAAAAVGQSAEAVLDAAVAREDAGDRDAAIVLLRAALLAPASDPDTVRGASFLLGTRLLEAERAADAAASVKGQLGHTPVDALQLRLMAVYATAMGRSGATSEAGASWSVLLGTSGLPDWLRLAAYTELSALARIGHDDPGLAQWLAKALALRDKPEDRYELASVQLRLRDAAAVNSLRTVVQRAPETGYALQALTDMRLNGFPIDPGDEGLVYYRHNLYADARRVLTAAVTEGAIDGPTRAFRLFYLAAAYEDGGQLKEAVANYDRAAEASPASAYAHRAKYWAARSVERLGDADAAAARYVALIKDGPRGEFDDEAAFRAGFVFLDRAKPAAALDAWAAAPAGPRIGYWRGRAQQQLGDSAGATATWRSVARDWPLDYYGIEAGRRISGAGPVNVSYVRLPLSTDPDWAALAAWLSGPAGAAPIATGPTEANILLRLGLREEAEGLLLDAADGAGPWRLLELAREAWMLKLPGVAARLGASLRRSTAGAGSAAPRDLDRLQFPIGYNAQLDATAKSFNLDPLLIAAIVEQESLWDASIISAAGAIGLMQIEPDTGQAVARELGVSGYVVADLLRPEVSLRFGTYYVTQQLKRFQDVYAALAAYNGGPENAARWRDAAPASGADYVSAIDFSETQDYVRRIMEHYAQYKHAYE